MRLLVIAMTLVFALFAAPALAQDEVPDDVPVAAGTVVAPVTEIPTPPGSTAQSLFFWLFGVTVIAGAIATITRRNAVSAVMCLVGTFLGISGLYAMLFAHFLAVIQILVYAGAIMVLFVFVVMILNKEEEEPWALRGLLGKALAGLALVYVTVRLIQVLWQVPAKVAQPATMPVGFGTTQAIAETMFGPYLFPFEAVSLILLIAVVGAIVLAHPAHPNVGEEELS